MTHRNDSYVGGMLEEKKWAEGYFAYAGINFGFILLAALCVMVEPVAAGSGIPETKCRNNNFNILF